MIYISEAESAAHVTHELAYGAMEAALIAKGEVLAGTAEGRRRAQDVTIFDSSGVSIQDLYIAREIIAAVRGEAIAPR